MTRAAIYVRQSKDIHGDGLAVARQQEACEKLCADRGWDVKFTVADNDTSATAARRPGFAQVMGMVVARSVDVVVVWAVDRLVRKLSDLESVIEVCEQAGVKLATVSGDLDMSTDQGRLVARILASVARGEMERKSARQKLAAQQAAQSGKRWKGAPRSFGYQADHVTPEPAEAKAVLDACHALLAGSTLAAVTRDWQARNLITVQGRKPFTRQSVRTILRNPAVAGLATYHGEIVGKGDWEPIVSEDLWRGVFAVLDDPSRKPPKGVRSLLGGLATCSCGNAVSGSQSYQHRAIYRCNPATRSAPGPHVAMRIEPVDEYVTAVIVGRLSQPDLADLLMPSPGADVSALRAEATAIRVRLDQLGADFVEGSISRSMLLAATARATARLSEIDEELAEAASVSILAPFTATGNAWAVWGKLDLPRKRATINALTPVILHPAGRGSRVFDPETVQLPGH